MGSFKSRGPALRALPVFPGAGTTGPTAVIGEPPRDVSSPVLRTLGVFPGADPVALSTRAVRLTPANKRIVPVDAELFHLRATVEGGEHRSGEMARR